MKLPQLTLRDLFWLVLVAGLILGWSIEHFGQEGRHRKLASDYTVEILKVYELTKELQKLGYTIDDSPQRIDILPPIQRGPDS